MISMSSAGFAGVTRIMVFIDGQYVMQRVKEIYTDTELDFGVLVDRLRRDAMYGALIPQLIRAYYYDAEPEPNDIERIQNQNIFLDKIAALDYFEVRSGRTKKTGRGHLRQKGVDTLVAIDMLSKAYENHYDVAILVSGDDDFLDLVRAVKDAGKQVFGAFSEKHVSDDLKFSFDRRFDLEKIIVAIRSKRPVPVA